MSLDQSLLAHLRLHETDQLEKVVGTVSAQVDDLVS